jgi:hypothetical protein
MNEGELQIELTNEAELQMEPTKHLLKEDQANFQSLMNYFQKEQGM